MTSIAPGSHDRKVVVGVDTHKYVHVAVALDELGARLAEQHVATNREGYARLEAWAASLGRVSVFGVEGTGSYGAGLAGFLRRMGYRVVEVNRGDRRSRRTNGKSDTLDAEAAARAVLNGTALAVPKSAEGTVEMIRQVKVARDTARKGRTSAIVTLKALLVTAPSELPEQLVGLTDKILIHRCANLRPGALSSPVAAAKHSLRALAKRHQVLSNEMAAHDAILDQLTIQHAPCGRGSGSALTPPPKCSLSSATTPSGCAPKRRLPSSAAPALSLPRLAFPSGTAFPGAGTERPTPLFTGPS
jgi:transposase